MRRCRGSHHRLGGLLPALIVSAFAAKGAIGQEVSPDIVKAQLGEWLVVPDDGTTGCRVRLEPGRVPGGGMAARPAPDCSTKLPILAPVASWSMEGGVTLRDAARRTILSFGEDETTLLKTGADRTPQYLMVQAKPGVERVPVASALAGRWEMRRPGGPALCHVVFRDRPAGADTTDNALTVEPGCDTAVARLKLSSWRVEDFTLMLYGAKEASLAFEPTATGFDKAAREGGKPLSLVRAP